MLVDITNKEALITLLNHLTERSEAQWGLMKPQHMIEHLTATITMSNGKKQLEQRVTDEQAKTAKAAFIHTNIEMVRGLKTPSLPEVPGPFVLSTLQEAKNQLQDELKCFIDHFNQHPTATFIHPRFGNLNYKEWLTFHNKHFLHHFKQFGLIAS